MPKKADDDTNLEEFQSLRRSVLTIIREMNAMIAIKQGGHSTKPATNNQAAD